MMRVFICPNCGRERVVSKFLRAECYTCGAEMRMCRLSYLEWVELDESARARERERGRNSIFTQHLQS